MAFELRITFSMRKAFWNVMGNCHFEFKLLCEQDLKQEQDLVQEVVNFLLQNLISVRTL